MNYFLKNFFLSVISSVWRVAQKVSNGFFNINFRRGGSWVMREFWGDMPGLFSWEYDKYDSTEDAGKICRILGSDLHETNMKKP